MQQRGRLALAAVIVVLVVTDIDPSTIDEHEADVRATQIGFVLSERIWSSVCEHTVVAVVLTHGIHHLLGRRSVRMPGLVSSREGADV